jgi:glucosyl-3-phosphoglycerate synthase
MRSNKTGVTCILPALNEGKTIVSVIQALQKIKEISEILVVDDGSTDRTAEVAQEAGARVVSHVVNFGKGAAMKTGASKAKNKYILYVDADIENLSPIKIRRLIRPLLAGEADFVKGAYVYNSARVSKLVVKPLLKILYPWLKLEHPISGEIAINKNKITWSRIQNNWGVDIQLVLQAAQKKLRIVEVSLGKKQHKHQDLDNLAKMSDDIIRTILSELNLISHRYRLVCFDLDKTLINQSSIELFAKEWGFEKELEGLQKKVEREELPDREITKTLARHFRGRTRSEIYAVCEKIELSPYAKEVVKKLRKQRYMVRIISAAYSPVVKYFASKLNIYDYICPELENKKGVYTGRLKKSKFPTQDAQNCQADLYVDKAKAVRWLCRELGIKKENVLSVGDGKSDEGMFAASDLSLGYRTYALGDHKIECLSEVLVYVE